MDCRRFESAADEQRSKDCHAKNYAAAVSRSGVPRKRCEHSSDPRTFEFQDLYSRRSGRRWKIDLLRATPNARICLNFVKDKPHIEQTTRQIVLAEQFCSNSAIFHRRGMCEPASYKRHTVSSSAKGNFLRRSTRRLESRNSSRVSNAMPTPYCWRVRRERSS